MTIESEAQLEALKRIGHIVARCLEYMSKALEPGITTRELDDLGRAYLEKHGARSAPELTYKFPGATCISVNEACAHGIPGPRRLAAGDLVNIDVSAELDGIFADTGGSFIIPPATRIKKDLCAGTKAALEAAIEVVKAGEQLNVIGAAVERVAKSRKLTVIRNLGSHGVGGALHEEPGFIPSYFDRNDRRKLKENMVITIEPFLSTGARQVEELDDGWTLHTGPHHLAAQYEHTMVITKGKPIVVTR